jgi:hypothetical protein
VTKLDHVVQKPLEQVCRRNLEKHSRESLKLKQRLADSGWNLEDQNDNRNEDSNNCAF